MDEAQDEDGDGGRISPRWRGIWENVLPFIPRLRFFFFFPKWK